MSPRFFALLFCLFLSPLLPAFAEDTPLSFVEAVPLMLAQDKALSLYEQELEIATFQQTINLDSNLELRLSDLQSFAPTNPDDRASIALRMPVQHPGDRTRLKRQGLAYVIPAEQAIESKEWAITVKAWTLFQLLALNMEEETLIQHLLETHTEALSASQASLEAGANTEIQRLRSELQSLKSQSRLTATTLKGNHLEQAIHSLTNTAPSRPIAPSAPLFPSTFDPKIHAETALKNHPKYIASQASIDAAQAHTQQTKIDAKPWLKFIQIGYVVPNSSTIESNDHRLTFDASLSVPSLRPSVNGTAQAEAEVSAARINSDLVAQQILEVILNDAQRLSEVQSKLNAFNDNMIETSERMYGSAKAGLEEGRIPLQDFLHFKADTIEIQLQLIAKQIAVINAQASLLASLGYAPMPLFPSSK